MLIITHFFDDVNTLTSKVRWFLDAEEKERRTSRFVGLIWNKELESLY